MADDLCYLDSRMVESPVGTLADLELCSRDDKNLGTVDGVLIEPTQRRVLYFVVRPSSRLFRKRYLLSVQTVAHIEPERQMIRIDAAAAAVPAVDFNADEVRPFTEEDAITTMFAPHAA